MDFDKAQSKLETCLLHADDLLRSAKTVLSTDDLPNVAFHLAALALEEIGKAGIFGVLMVPENREETREYFEKRFENHYQKLLWAIWTPLLTGRKPFGIEDFKASQKLALEIHETRQQGLYVSFDVSDQNAPREAITNKKVENFIEFVEARKELEASKKQRDMGEPELERLRFFFDVLEDQHFRPRIFSADSLKKLSEYGEVSSWLDWIKGEFEEFESANRAMADAEWKRVTPKDSEDRQDKWEIRIKLFTPTLIIRPKPLRWWNDNHTMWKLSMAGSQKNQIYVDMVLPNTVLVADLYYQAFDYSQLLILSLNIGTRAFLWWSMPKHDGEYYEKITDLENDAMVTVKIPSITVIPWNQENLSENMLKNAAMCFAGIAHLDKDSERGPFYRYLNGMATLAAVTPAFRIERNAVEHFYYSLIEGMKIFGDWDEAKSVNQNLETFFNKTGANEELRSFLYEIAESTEKILGNEKEEDETAADHAAGLKVLCDAYFLHALHRRAVEVWEREEGDGPGDDGADKF